jgi:thiol-disulfide isomerase/thioredoxin
MRLREAVERVRGAWRWSRQRWWTRWAGDLVLLAVVLAAVAAWQTRHLPEAGTPVPDLALRTLTGEPARLADLRGKPVVLALWAPWCGVCKVASSNLSSVQRLVGGSAHVVSVALAYEDVADVERYMREQRVDYPVLLGDDSFMRALRVDRFPTVLFLSADGRVEDAAVGYTTRLGLLWRLWL